MCWLVRGECSRLLGRGGGCGPSPTCPRVVRTDPKRRVHGTPKKVKFFQLCAHSFCIFGNLPHPPLCQSLVESSAPLTTRGSAAPTPPEKFLLQKKNFCLRGFTPIFFSEFQSEFAQKYPKFHVRFKTTISPVSPPPTWGGGVNPPHQAFLHSPAPVDVGQKSLFRLPNPHPISHSYGTLITATDGAQRVHTGRCRR